MLNAPSAWSFGREAVWARVFEEWGGLTNPTPSCMKLLESITLPSQQWHVLLAPTRLCLVVYTNWVKMCKVQDKTCTCEGPSQSERIKLNWEIIKLKLPSRRPNLKAWLKWHVPRWCLISGLTILIWLLHLYLNWNEMCSRAIALTGV